MSDYVIRGYANIFGVTVFAQGAYERMSRNAFATMLQRPTSIKLQAYDHDPARPALASTTNGTLRLHADDHGLAFEAHIPAEYGAVIRDVIAGRYNRCSVGLITLGATHGRIGAYPLNVINSAAIDHVALVDDAVYPTAAWVPEALNDRMPSVILNAAEQWEAGRAGGMTEHTAARLRGGRR